MRDFPPLLGPVGGRADTSHDPRLRPEPPPRAVQRLAGIVLTAGRGASEVEIEGERWSMTPDRQPRGRLATGAAVLLEAGEAAPGGERVARLTMIGGERLQPPLQVILRPSTASARGPAVIPLEEGAVTVVARRLQDSGEAAGPPLRVRVTRASAPEAPPRPSPAVSSLGTSQPAAVPPTTARAAPPAPPGARVAAAGALPAEVLSVDAAGRTLIRAGGVTLRIEESVHLPPATSILVIPTGTADGRAADPAAAMPPLLRALLQALRLAPESGPLRLPPPDVALTVRLLALVECARMAATGEEDADFGTASLRSVLGDFGRAAHEPLPGGWRAIQLPLGQENELYPLKLYLRDDPDANAEQEPHGRRAGGGRGRCRRAVFEVEFSRLGRMQLDVLCRDERFDLAVRSPRPLPEALRAEVAALFTAAQEVAGLAGALTFQADALIDLPAPSLRASHSLIA